MKKKPRRKFTFTITLLQNVFQKQKESEKKLSEFPLYQYYSIFVVSYLPKINKTCTSISIFVHNIVNLWFLNNF